MANLLNFKFGLQPSLASQELQAGTVYVTTDEHALYLDLPKTPDSTELQRIRIGDIIVVDSARVAKPPFAEGAFYYFVAENALLRWDGSAWKQLNADTDLSGITTAVDNEIERSKAADKEHSDAIAALQSAINNYVLKTNFEEFKASNTTAIADAKKAGTDAQGTANTALANAASAQSTADNAKSIAENALPLDGSKPMTGNINMNSKKIINLAAPEANSDAANKKYVDDAKAAAMGSAAGALERANEAYNLANTAKGAASSAQGTADTAVEKANAAQEKADEAYTLAGTKATLADVDAAGYALTTEAQAMANAVLGSSSDAATAATVYGAIAKAAAAAEAAANAQRTADSKITLAEVQELKYATQEQLNKKAGELLGSDANDADDKTIYGAHKAAAAALEKAQKGVDDASAAKSAADDAQETADTAVENAAKAQNAADGAQATANDAKGKAEAAQSDINAWKNAHSTDYTNEAIDAKVKSASDAASAAQKTADDAKEAAEAAQADADQGIKDAAAALARANQMLPLDGSKTMLGAINMGGKQIVNMAAPTEDAHATTKKYVDDKVKVVSGDLNTLSKTVDNVKTTADGALQKSGGTMTGAIDMGNKKITNLATPTANTDATNKKYVDDAIAAGIKANDAMTFKGTLGGTGATVTALPSTAQKGDTYKVALAGTYNGVAAKIGDLFINNAADDATASWVHVSSGYEAEYIQTLIADTTTVYLTDGVNDTIGQAVNGVKFVGNANSNLQFAVSTEGNIHTVTASMVWGTF